MRNLTKTSLNIKMKVLPTPENLSQHRSLFDLSDLTDLNGLVCTISGRLKGIHCSLIILSKY